MMVKLYSQVFLSFKHSTETTRKTWSKKLFFYLKKQKISFLVKNRAHKMNFAP